MWFGTAIAQGDSIVRDDRTTSIPYKAGQWFAWSVETGLDEPVEMSMILQYPGDSTVIDKSPELEVDPSARTVTMPFGPVSGPFSAEFQVEDGDPPGVYRAHLFVEGERIAAVTYELEVE
jgi:hypothetical protein